MRRMNRSMVRTWIPGELLELVDFGNGLHGMESK